VTDDAGQESRTGPIVRRNEWQRHVFAERRPSRDTAVVLVKPGGDMQVVWPDEPWRPLRGSVQVVEVDITSHFLTFTVSLPAKDLGEFQANVRLEWSVVDPAEVVRRNVTSVRRVVSVQLQRRAGTISAQFGIHERAAAEDEINRQLRSVAWPGWRRQGEPPLSDGEYIGAKYGLWTRPLIQLSAAEAPARDYLQHSDERYRDQLNEDLEAFYMRRELERQRETEEQAAREAREELRQPSTEDQVAAEDLDSPGGIRDMLRQLLAQEQQAVLQAPEPLPTYDDVVRRALADLVEPGRLLFNPPDRMQLGKTARVEVRLTRTLLLDAELVKGLVGLGEPHAEDIPTAPSMAVTLQGEGFKVTSYSDEEQLVTQDQITTWEFDIKALKPGRQRLVLSVSLRIPITGQPAEHKSIPVREATIEVQISAAVAMQFVSAYWQWIIGTAIALGALLTAIIVH